MVKRKKKRVVIIGNSAAGLSINFKEEVLTMRRLAIVLISVMVTFWLSAPILQAQFLEAGIVKFRVPVEAPDFRLKKLTGGEISLKELKGKVVILNFFDTA